MSESNQYEYTAVAKSGDNAPVSLEELTAWYESKLPPALRDRVAAGDAVVEIRAYNSTADSADASRQLSEEYVAQTSQMLKQIAGSNANIQTFAYGGDASRRDSKAPALGGDRLVVRVIP